MIVRLAIIADDLTGALDAAAPFAARGARVQVALGPVSLPAALASGADVVAISTDSRETSPKDAADAVRAALGHLPSEAALFKKVDSRMKGNIAAEVGVLPPAPLLVSPAIPGFGRLVRGGRLTGQGVAEDIAIAPRLGANAGRATIPDIETNGDLARAVEEMGDGAIMVGARGLAEAVAGRLFPRPIEAAPPLPGPGALFIIGSRDPITLAAADRLRAAGTTIIDAPNGMVPAGTDRPSALAIQAVAGDRNAAPEEVARNLARTTAPLLAGHRGTVLLTGGATASAVLSAAGIDRLELLGECLPGLPVSRADGLTIVTKSGGFGGPETLAQVLAMIAGGEGCPQ